MTLRTTQHDVARLEQGATVTTFDYVIAIKPDAMPRLPRIMARVFTPAAALFDDPRNQAAPFRTGQERVSSFLGRLNPPAVRSLQSRRRYL